MNVDEPAGRMDAIGDSPDGDGAEGDRRHEVAVHDVDMDNAGARLEHRVDLRAETGEIG
jgi:hypothetical protein